MNTPEQHDGWICIPHTLFTDDTRFAVYMNGEGSEPTYVLEGREALTPVFADPNRYETTTRAKHDRARG